MQISQEAYHFVCILLHGKEIETIEETVDHTEKEMEERTPKA